MIIIVIGSFPYIVVWNARFAETSWHFPFDPPVYKQRQVPWPHMYLRNCPFTGTFQHEKLIYFGDGRSTIRLESGSRRRKVRIRRSYTQRQPYHVTPIPYRHSTVDQRTQHYSADSTHGDSAAACRHPLSFDSQDSSYSNESGSKTGFSQSGTKTPPLHPAALKTYLT